MRRQEDERQWDIEGSSFCRSEETKKRQSVGVG